MNDMEPYVPRSVVTKHAVAAIAGLAGGIALSVASALPSPVSIGVGIAAGVLGFTAFRSRDNADRKGGAILAVAGVLTIASRLPVLGTLASPLLTIGIVGLFASGIWNGVKFFKGLKSRM
jgi:hypothetical protein